MFNPARPDSIGTGRVEPRTLNLSRNEVYMVELHREFLCSQKKVCHLKKNLYLEEGIIIHAENMGDKPSWATGFKRSS